MAGTTTTVELPTPRVGQIYSPTAQPWAESGIASLEKRQQVSAERMNLVGNQSRAA
jgi:hypothetical protein